MQRHPHDHHVTQNPAGEAEVGARTYAGEHHGVPGSASAPDAPATTVQGTDRHLVSGHAGMDHAAMGHRPGPTGSRVTGPQVAAVAALSLLALVAAAVFSALFANLTLSARDVGGLVMPPGMIITRVTSA